MAINISSPSPLFFLLIKPRSNSAIFTNCIRPLLETLKVWDPERHGQKGLELMVSASSPSDTEHRWNRCEVNNDYPFHYAEDLDLQPDIFDYHREHVVNSHMNPRVHSHNIWPWPCETLERAHGTPLQLLPRRDERGRFTSQVESLPAVPIVKGLVMRRQFRREIHVAALSWLLARSFVALEWFRLERTISANTYTQYLFDKGMQESRTQLLRPVIRQS